MRCLEELEGLQRTAWPVLLGKLLRNVRGAFASAVPRFLCAFALSNAWRDSVEERREALATLGPARDAVAHIMSCLNK